MRLKGGTRMHAMSVRVGELALEILWCIIAIRDQLVNPESQAILFGGSLAMR